MISEYFENALTSPAPRERRTCLRFRRNSRLHKFAMLSHRVAILSKSLLPSNELIYRAKRNETTCNTQTMLHFLLVPDALLRVSHTHSLSPAALLIASATFFGTLKNGLWL